MSGEVEMKWVYVVGLYIPGSLGEPIKDYNSVIGMRWCSSVAPDQVNIHQGREYLVDFKGRGRLVSPGRSRHERYTVTFNTPNRLQHPQQTNTAHSSGNSIPQVSDGVETVCVLVQVWPCCRCDAGGSTCVPYAASFRRD